MRCGACVSVDSKQAVFCFSSFRSLVLTQLYQSAYECFKMSPVLTKYARETKFAPRAKALLTTGLSDVDLDNFAFYYLSKQVGITQPQTLKPPRAHVR